MDHSGRSTQPNSRVEAIFVGAGAVGCFYASRLHNPEHNIHVSLVARSNYKAIASKGVSMRTHSFGDYSFKPRNVYPSVEAAATETSRGSKEQQGWDYIIVTTKALPDYSDDSKMIESLVGPTSCIVLIQNGLGVEAPFRARFPSNPIVSAVTVVSAEQVSHGVIKQNRWTRISIGPYTNGLGSGDARLGMLGSKAVDWLDRSWGPEGGGIRDVEPHDEVGLQVIRWHKLCINAAFNPSAVLSGGRGNADMVRDSELREHLMGVMEEIWKAAPLILDRPFPEELASPERIIKSTERNTGSKPSMLLDWEAGRPLELEVILGNPVRIAREHGIQMPRLQSLYALLKSAQVIREMKQKQGGQSML